MGDIQTKRDILSAQSMYVVKGNDLIQKSRYSLSLMEQKAILFMISKIKPTDKPFTEYEFSIKDFCLACNLNTQAGTYSRYVRNLLDKLGEKVITVELDKGKTLKAHWYSSSIIDDNTDSMRFVFDKNISPYLFELKSFYTQYSIEYALPMRSKYGIRLYEFLKSVKSKSYRQRFTVEEIRERVECFSYPAYKEFRRNVLDPALEDINSYTDLKVQYVPVKKGNKITHLEFTILAYHDYERTGERFYNRRERLGSISEMIKDEK